MKSGGTTLRVSAPAKINLYLEILGKRPDGYHDLRSLVVPVSICDELTLTGVEESPEITVACELVGLPAANGHLAPAPDDNLAARAGRLLQEVTGCRHGANIAIRKEIPIGGGMGGGSADAAGALIGLNALWGTGLGRPALMELGARLGSDIPAMVHGGAVLMEGRGERLQPVSCHWAPGTEWWVVVVNPGFACPTRDVYRRFRTKLTSDDKSYINASFALHKGDLGLACESLRNSLETPVFRKYPLLAILAGGLGSAGAAGVLLSGSGASVFALAANRDRAFEIEERMKRDCGPWLWTRVARVLPDGVMVAHGPLEARV